MVNLSPVPRKQMSISYNSIPQLILIEIHIVAVIWRPGGEWICQLIYSLSLEAAEQVGKSEGSLRYSCLCHISPVDMQNTILQGLNLQEISLKYNSTEIWLRQQNKFLVGQRLLYVVNSSLFKVYFKVV